MDRGFDAVQGYGSARREFLQRGVAVTATGAAALVLAGCATERYTQPVPGRELAELASRDLLNGGAAPVPIPWLDRNGSHNQSPEPGQEPSNIYHFKGQVARTNDFTGMGTDHRGNRIAFGAKSTAFSLMRGEYFAGRQARSGTFAHL